MTARAFPYRRVTGGIEASPWAYETPHGSLPLPDALEDWDYATTLELVRTIRVEGRELRDTAGLPDEAHIGLSARWTASASLMRGAIAPVYVEHAPETTIELRMSLPGQELGGDLRLDTHLVLLEGLESSASTRRATRPGSVLWSDDHRIRLQGDAPMFPIAVADFADLPYPAAAAWVLELDGDVTAAAMGSVLLLVNQAHPTVVSALTEARAPGSQAKLVLSALRSDIARSLVESAISMSDFDPAGDYPDESVGRMLQALIQHVLGIGDWESVKAERERSPTLFAARLQAATGLWAQA